VLERPANEEPSLTGFGHMVVLVLLPSHLSTDNGAEVLYHCDVGYGAGCALRPLLLREGHEEQGREGQAHRLVQTLHPQSALEESDDGPHCIPDLAASAQHMWALQHRTGDGEWLTQYVFMLTETLPTDYEVSRFTMPRASGC
jgi:arylamine N-acetyltransferase